MAPDPPWRILPGGSGGFAGIGSISYKLFGEDDALAPSRSRIQPGVVRKSDDHHILSPPHEILENTCLTKFPVFWLNTCLNSLFKTLISNHDPTSCSKKKSSIPVFNFWVGKKNLSPFWEKLEIRVTIWSNSWERRNDHFETLLCHREKNVKKTWAEPQNLLPFLWGMPPTEKKRVYLYRRRRKHILAQPRNFFSLCSFPNSHGCKNESWDTITWRGILWKDKHKKKFDDT